MPGRGGKGGNRNGLKSEGVLNTLHEDQHVLVLTYTKKEKMVSNALSGARCYRYTAT